VFVEYVVLWLDATLVGETFVNIPEMKSWNLKFESQAPIHSLFFWGNYDSQRLFYAGHLEVRLKLKR
jgi:hypothetical protein